MSNLSMEGLIRLKSQRKLVRTCSKRKKNILSTQRRVQYLREPLSTAQKVMCLSSSLPSSTIQWRIMKLDTKGEKEEEEEGLPEGVKCLTVGRGVLPQEEGRRRPLGGNMGKKEDAQCVDDQKCSLPPPSPPPPTTTDLINVRCCLFRCIQVLTTFSFFPLEKKRLLYKKEREMATPSRFNTVTTLLYYYYY